MGIADDSLDQLVNITLQDVSLLDSINLNDLIERIHGDDEKCEDDEITLNYEDLNDLLQDDEKSTIDFDFSDSIVLGKNRLFPEQEYTNQKHSNKNNMKLNQSLINKTNKNSICSI